MSKIAFLFPGQGAQFVGMGRQAAEKCPAARALFERAAEILGFDLARVCREGPAAELDRTDVSQPALFVSSLAALELLRAESPDIVASCGMTAGLSLGEYTALVFAGSLSFDDGLRVVRQRGLAMQAAAEATPSGMICVLLLDRDQVVRICAEAQSAGTLEIANSLCPGNLVLSGSKPACLRAAELAEQAGGKVVHLTVEGAFHTRLMQPAEARVAEALAGVPVASPRVSVYSNVDGQPHSDPQEVRQLLVRQVISPVQWEDSVRNMLAAGAGTFYEIGPGKVLRGLLKRIDRKVECRSVGEA